MIKQRWSKETLFLYSTFVVGDRKKCFRTNKLSQAELGLPEGVRGYVERRSLFVTKRLKNLEKSNKVRFFNQIKLFSNYELPKYRIIIAFLRSGHFLHPLIL